MDDAMREPTFSPILSVSKKVRVAKALRDAIVSGQMRPGDAIVESRVARQLGVGQPLVREALLELEHQGFVQRVPYRGTSVTRLGPEEIEQIQSMRVELEALAIAWARARARPQDVVELRALVARMGESARRSDLAGFNDHDLALHRSIWQLSGNKYLADALERAVVPMLTFFYLSSGRVSALHVESVALHAALVDEIEAPRPGPNGAHAALESLKDQSRTFVAPEPVSATPAPRR